MKKLILHALRTTKIYWIFTRRTHVGNTCYRKMDGRMCFGNGIQRWCNILGGTSLLVHEHEMLAGASTTYLPTGRFFLKYNGLSISAIKWVPIIVRYYWKSIGKLNSRFLRGSVAREVDTPVMFQSPLGSYREKKE